MANEPTPKRAKSKTWTILFNLVPFLRPYRFWILVHLTCSFSHVILSIALVYLTQKLTDTAIGAQQVEFVRSVTLMSAVVVTGALASYLERYASVRHNTYAIRDLRNHMADHIQRLPISYVETHHTGDMVSRLNNDVAKIASLLRSIPGYIYQPLLFACAFAYMSLINWRLLLAVCALNPVLALLVNKASKSIQGYSKQQMEGLGEVNSVIQDTIGGISVLKAFNLQQVLLEKYKAVVKEVERKRLCIDRRVACLASVQNMLRYAPMLIVPLYGGYLTFRGEMTPGDLLAYNLLIWFVIRPVEAFLGLIRQARETVPAVERVFQILDQPPEYAGEQGFSVIPGAVPVEFEAVSFGYAGQRNVLDNLSFQVTEGKTVALAGASGSGKSTVFKLLCGFYRPARGHVKLYGNDLFRSDLPAARAQMSLVSQDIYLFPTTIVENIAFGRLGATRDEIIAAAKAANAHDFIMEQPEAYDTPIGEQGVKLSGGERQRIALARAILKDAPVLLLDEPTSALDTRSETMVQEALERLMQGRTVLIVAHRLSTIRGADQILVLDQGSFRESGTHEELMGTDSLYKKLYMKQMLSAEHGSKQSTPEET